MLVLDFMLINLSMFLFMLKEVVANSKAVATLATTHIQDSISSVLFILLIEEILLLF